jgi:hypothetical protein
MVRCLAGDTRARECFSRAASVAALPITTEVMVAQKKDRQDRLTNAQRRHGRGGFLTGCIGPRVSATVFL